MDQKLRRKIFAGRRVRKLRAVLSLSQSAMAGELGISISYLNLLERNERPLTAQLLIKLGETYGIEARSFAQEEEIRAVAELEEIFADPIFRQEVMPRAEVAVLAEDAPRLAEAVKRLYRSYLEIRDIQTDSVAHTRGDDHEIGAAATPHNDPVEQVRHFIEQSGNYFPSLDNKAEALAQIFPMQGGMGFEAISSRLQSHHQVRVQITALEDMRSLLRHYDRHRKKLMLSELLDHSSRIFQAAFQLGLLEAAAEIDELSVKVGPQDSPEQKLARIVLANYFAAALMMPYGIFHDTAVAHGYDLDVLSSRFSASFEQVAHRLTTLARPNKRGVPFFLIRVDAAGNVSKRFSSGAFPFSRFGGTCARWNIHSAFGSPGKLERDIVEMPDGSTWFTLSRTAQHRATVWGQSPAQFVVGLGCEMRFAGHLIYSKGIDLKSHVATPIGINCRLCERQNCAQRSAPPLMRRTNYSENSRGFTPFDVEG